MAKRNKFTVAAIAVLLTISPALAETKGGFLDTAIELYKSLKPDQRSRAALKFDDAARNEQKFPGGKRAGIQLKDLDEHQRELAMKLITQFTSDYGKKKVEAVAAQEQSNLMQYYLAFFGEPGEGKDYAWRIAEHHLTLVDVEVAKGEPVVFGPILLGANPPVLWDEDEAKMMDLYKSLTPADKEKVCKTGKGESAKPIGDAGAKVGDLSSEAQQKVKAVLQQRLEFFSPEIQQRITRIVEKQREAGDLKIVFYGEATARCADGGKWDFKLGGPNFLCDYENTRGHIHLSMKATDK
jgi:hypothetical protein